MKNFVAVALICGWALSTEAQTLIHHYTFDADVSDSAGTDDGALVSGATVSGGTLNLSAGQSVDFSAHIVPTSGSYSITLFAQETAHVGNFMELISQGSSGGPGFYIGHDPGYGIRVTDLWASTGVAFPDDNLQHHYALVVDSLANDSKLYLDGTLAATLPSAIATTTGGDNTALGKQFSGDGEFFTGKLDDVRVYTGALSASDVAALAVVPEPTTLALLALGCAGVAARLRRKS